MWRLLAVLAVLLGVIGIVLPVLPTVPFMLLAAWAGSKGWPQLEAWLLQHPTHGPMIRRWRERGAVPRRAKWFATIGMSASAVWVSFMPAPLWVKLAVPAVMLCVAVWLWMRPEE